MQWHIWALLIGVVYFVLACSVTIHAVLRKRSTRSVIGWVGLVWLAPFLGSIAYLCLGVNRIERKAASLQCAKAWDPAQQPVFTDEDRMQIDRFANQYQNFVGLATAGRQLTARTLAPGNSVEPLVDGDQAYPAMIESINNAQHSVALLSYIFDSDRSGDEFLEALVNAQNRGVAVRVLIDDVGSKYSKPNMVPRLEEAGLKVARFLPTRLSILPKYANMRNHRKILVVDGTVGFTGGTNIREGHCLKLEPAFPVQCLHFKIQGPVVAHLQRAFAIDWAFCVGESISGEQWFPKIERNGQMWARGIEHGPDEQFEKLTHLIASALASARERVIIFTPYFLPKSSLLEALAVTALRGVDVQVFLPLVNNIKLVQWACNAQLWQILEKGCRVFFTPPPFDHTKLMIVDDVWSLIGSTNWDPRSLRLNFEFNVEVYSIQFNQLLRSIVEPKIASAQEVTLEDINRRSFPVQLRDGLARLLKPYL